ncbi:hypothetical protein AADG42_18225 [Ammonicoccus fulvus]|uniref:Uncharacterized protein n=1 Tax=Ammonicoccus fulvus TaxID=3138240 RepID=A0ABZ3FSW4_9ACTN
MPRHPEFRVLLTPAEQAWLHDKEVTAMTMLHGPKPERTTPGYAVTVPKAAQDVRFPNGRRGLVSRRLPNGQVVTEPAPLAQDPAPAEPAPSEADPFEDACVEAEALLSAALAAFDKDGDTDALVADVTDARDVLADALADQPAEDTAASNRRARAYSRATLRRANRRTARGDLYSRAWPTGPAA